MRRQEVLNARESESERLSLSLGLIHHVGARIRRHHRGAKKEKRLGRRRIMIILSAHIKSAGERAPAPRNYYYLARSVAHTTSAEVKNIFITKKLYGRG